MIAAGSRAGGFPKSQRVRDRLEFQAAQKRGVRLHTDYFVVLLWRRPETGAASPRLGITASRKAGNAVTRNRAKRLIREWFRKNSPRLPEGVDLIVVCRPDLPWLALSQVEVSLGRLLTKIKNLNP